MQLQPLEKLYRSTEGVVSIVTQVLIAVASVPAVGALKPTVGGITITALGLGQLLQRGLLKAKALDAGIGVPAPVTADPHATSKLGVVIAGHVIEHLDGIQNLREQMADQEFAENQRDVSTNALAAQDNEEQPLVDEVSA